jgi:hypothetical protein
MKAKETFRENLLAVVGRNRKLEEPDAKFQEHPWEETKERHTTDEWAVALAEQARIKAEHNTLVTRLAACMRENQGRIK